MDYEQKYNEALERAKKWEREHPHGYVIKDMMEYIFPELRESEDERIRRTLVEYFGPKVQLDFVRGVPIQKIRDWLEKQKESLHISETCKENADSFTDEDERMVKDIRLALLSVDDAFWATHSLTAKEAIVLSKSSR